MCVSRRLNPISSETVDDDVAFPRVYQVRLSIKLVDADVGAAIHDRLLANGLVGMDGVMNFRPVSVRFVRSAESVTVEVL